MKEKINKVIDIKRTEKIIESELHLKKVSLKYLTKHQFTL